jgi:adenylate cyclase
MLAFPLGREGARVSQQPPVVPRQRLEAILAADAAGYSRLMAMNESSTVAALDAAREVFRDETESHAGRVIDTAGDSVLAVFDTATGAVDAALQIQRRLEEMAAGIPADRRMRFRIGVHMGDVIEKQDGTVYGDGVNIAARLQGLAPPGGVTVSAAVQGAVRHRIDVVFEDLGDHQVKNISDPIRAYRVILATEPSSLVASVRRAITPARRRKLVVAGLLGAIVALLAIGGWLMPGTPVGRALALISLSGSRTGIERLSKPAIAVLAFHGESAGNPDDAMLGESVAEEMIAEFARNVDTPVVSGRSSFQVSLKKLTAQDAARQLAVRYLVDGSVRREGEQLAIRTQLVDGTDGRIVWTHDDQVGVSGLSGARIALMQRLAGSVTSSVWRVEKQRVLTRPPASLDAYTLAMRAYADKHRFTPDAYRAGRRDAEQAIRLDSDYAFAWAVLGYLNALDALMGMTGEWNYGRFGEALAQIDHAIQLDPSLALAHQARALVLSRMGRPAEALAAGETAVQLAPGDGDNLAILGAVQYEAGRVAESRKTLDKALLLYPIVPVYVSLFDARTHWAAREYEAAIKAASYCIDRAPYYLACRATRARTFFEMGRLDEARKDIEYVLKVQPHATRSVMGTTNSPELQQRLHKAAAALGLPSDD